MQVAPTLRDCIGGWKMHEATALEGLYQRLECPEAALEAAPEAALEAALEAGRECQRSMRGFISFSKISFAMIL